ncbi:MAG: NAD(P)-dependent oxidoreductase [Rhizobiales bacterium]|nr:NAD(P)-dependent oxidoreductase [Hyphomicrobiales bacterium]
MVKNLVIGSDGFVGKPFCRYLESIGEEVVRFDIKQGEDQDGRLVSLNLEDVDRVYFLAWDVGGAKYLYREDVQFIQLDWNLRLLLNIMPQLKESKVPFLFVSSQLAEEHDTVYGVTKRLGEVWTHLIDGVRVRLWNVYGDLEEFSERSHVVADFVHQALNDGEIRMLTTGEERRQFIHINDVCKAFHSALSNQYSGLYDVSSFEWVSIREIADIIAELTGAKVIPGEKIGSTPITPIQGKVPGWLPSVGIRDGLETMVNMARENK